VPSTGEDLRERPFERPRGAAASAGLRRQSPHVFIEVRELRLDPCPLAVANVFKAACASSVSADKCFHEHDWGPLEHPEPRGVVGTTAMLDRKSPLDPATAEGTQGQGSRTPSLDTPHRDCSRQRLRPNPDRFGHLLSRVPPSSRSGVTWGEDDAANAARACKAHVARGSCGARFPRRNRTFTNPRGLLSLAVRDANGEASSPSSELPGDYPQRLFHHPRTARGTLARIPMARPVLQGRTANRPVAERPQRPLTTSAFE